jgi:hypothetical protein
VLADHDVELRRAIETALAPWHLEVVLDDPQPSDITQAEQRAEFAKARFVVWREGRELVVFDRDHRAIDRRGVRAGVLDPVSAAAAALTVKTMMRLPPPEAGAVVVVVPPASPEPRGISWRVQGGIALRVARGSQTDAGARFTLAGLIRPSQDHGWRFGLAGDLGSPATVDHAGFKGNANDWALLAIASWTHESATWELEPWLAGGMTRSSASGADMSSMQNDGATLATLRAGVSARWRLGAWTAGGNVGLDATVGTPTYTKSGTAAPYYQPASFAVVAGVVVAADLGK